MIFGYQQTGGAGGPQLWQLNGGAPNSISVKTPTVNGIDSPNFFNNLLRIVSGGVVAVVSYVGSMWNDIIGNETLLVGVRDDNIEVTGGVVYENTLTGENMVMWANTTLKEIVIANSDGGSLSTSQKYTVTGISQKVKNTLSLEEVQRAASSQQEITEIVTALGTVFAYGSDSTGFIITDGTNQRFKVKPNGNILTDQVAAGLPGLPANLRLPVYDLAGALLGYIDLNN